MKILGLQAGKLKKNSPGDNEQIFLYCSKKKYGHFHRHQELNLSLRQLNNFHVNNTNPTLHVYIHILITKKPCTSQGIQTIPYVFL